MAGSFDKLIADLSTFQARKQLTKEFSKEIRKAAVPVRKAIRARALATLPKRGGLNAWVAKASVIASIKLSSTRASIKLKGSRKSTKNKADLKRLDAGRVRAPSWGHRTKNSWHSQSVTPGYFTQPATETDEYRKAVDAAVDKALEVITRG